MVKKRRIKCLPFFPTLNIITLLTFVGLFSIFCLACPLSVFAAESGDIVIATPSKPDLVADDISVSDTTVHPGQSVTVYWTAENQGTASCGHSYQGVMWSTKSIISTTDSHLADKYLGFMKVNDPWPQAHTIKIPSSATPGITYYIGVISDYNGGISESNEDNNNDGTPVAVQIILTNPRIIRLGGDLAFGDVTVGQNPQRTLTIYSDGNEALSVSSISYPSGFSGSWSGSIAAGSSRNGTVTFAPTSATSYGGTITVNSNKTSGTNTHSCSGKGVLSAPTVSASDGTYTDKVRITWNASSGATYYELYRAESAEATKTKIDPSIDPSVSNLTYDDITVIPGTTYYYWVKAKNLSGSSDFSNYDTGYSVPMVDVDGDRDIDLADAVLALQIACGIQEPLPDQGVGINGNGKIGLDDAIYVLEYVSGTR